MFSQGIPGFLLFNSRKKKWINIILLVSQAERGLKDFPLLEKFYFASLNCTILTTFAAE